ncbi:MAG: TIGR02186 family protein [Pseudomonadota bacterium]
MRVLLLLLLLLLLTLPARGEEIVADLSQDSVPITATFSGSAIFVFGAVKRSAPAPADRGALEAIVTVTGPSEATVVRRKSRTLGIWVNRDAVEVDRAPSFYAVASTAPLERILSHTENLRHRINLDHIVQLIDAPGDIEDVQAFREAVIRIRQDQGLYAVTPGIVELTDETLLKARIALPANLVEGDYRTRVFLLRDREVIDSFETSIAVRKEGLERFIYTLAHERPLIYGLASIFVALIAGWGASELFRLLRR